MTVNLIVDILAVLDTDSAALTAQATDLQSQIDALTAQLSALVEQQNIITRFRQLAADIQSGAAFSSVTVPGGTVPTGAPQPVTPGITGV